MRHNRNNQDLVKEERHHLKPLPLRRSADYDELTVRVSSSSTINVRHVVYSVPSGSYTLSLDPSTGTDGTKSANLSVTVTAN